MLDLDQRVASLRLTGDTGLCPLAFSRILYYLLSTFSTGARPSSVVRPVRLWPDHFLAEMVLAGPCFWPNVFFCRAVFSRFF